VTRGPRTCGDSPAAGGRGAEDGGPVRAEAGAEPGGGVRGDPGAGDGGPVAGDAGAGAPRARLVVADELPGDPVCLLPRVCPACGSVADHDPPVTCPGCGHQITVG
jgi:ribosomal protein S27AE